MYNDIASKNNTTMNEWKLMFFKLRSYLMRQMNSNEIKETSCDTIEIQWERLAQECMTLNYDTWKIKLRS